MPEHDEVITLIDEEGQEYDFVIIDILKVKNDEYAILLLEQEENDEAIILKIIKDEEDSDILIDIEDDQEWEAVAEAWEALVINEK
ncbi:MAG: DUF1292 domain-containing protein [Desulfotomaculum sp.]|nr:DUF1292 domain-containing protein [Desulfotomaculum sp.]MCL0080787.1 DUF1292 domain-containing protein [Peptococcaceae bacterium]